MIDDNVAATLFDFSDHNEVIMKINEKTNIRFIIDGEKKIIITVNKNDLINLVYIPILKQEIDYIKKEINDLKNK